MTDQPRRGVSGTAGFVLEAPVGAAEPDNCASIQDPGPGIYSGNDPVDVARGGSRTQRVSGEAWAIAYFDAFVHPSIRSFIHLYSHPITYSLINLSIQPFAYSSIHAAFSHSFTYQFIN